MNAEQPRPLMDLVSTGELARALAARSDAGWEPEFPADERRGWRASLRPLLKYLPWAMLPLGMLAVAGVVVAVRGMASGNSPEGGTGWLRFGLLVVGAVFVGLHSASLVSKTRAGKWLRSKWQRPAKRTVVPLLDAASLGTLRAGAGDGFGDPGGRARAKAKARRFAGSSSWWVLVVLALLLSAGIVALMLGLTLFELTNGRDAGPWLVLPGIAAVFAGLGFWMSLRTAMKSRDDLRQRRRLRLFRRVLGYIGRGWGGGHSGSGARTSSLTSNAGGAAGTQVASGLVGMGSVALFAGESMLSVPRRLLGATPNSPKVGGLGLAGFTVASVAMAWAGFGWPIDTGSTDSGPTLVSSVETPAADNDGGGGAESTEPTGEGENDEPLAADVSPTSEPTEAATVVPSPSPSPVAPVASGGSFSGGANPPAGPTPAGSGGLSGGSAASPTAVPPTATNTPVTPTATATTETPTVATDLPLPPPDEPTDPTRGPRDPREPDPTATPTPKPGGPPTGPTTFGTKSTPTPTPTVGSSVPKPTVPIGGFTS